MGLQLTDEQKKTIMEFKRSSAELQVKMQQLKSQKEILAHDKSQVELTLQYLKEQDVEQRVYYSLGRIFIKSTMDECIRGSRAGIDLLKADVQQVVDAIQVVEKQINISQKNFTEYLKVQTLASNIKESTDEILAFIFQSFSNLRSQLIPKLIDSFSILTQHAMASFNTPRSNIKPPSISSMAMMTHQPKTASSTSNLFTPLSTPKSTTTSQIHRDPFSTIRKTDSTPTNTIFSIFHQTSHYNADIHAPFPSLIIEAMKTLPAFDARYLTGHIDGASGYAYLIISGHHLSQPSRLFVWHFAHSNPLSSKNESEGIGELLLSRSSFNSGQEVYVLPLPFSTINYHLNTHPNARLISIIPSQDYAMSKIDLSMGILLVTPEGQIRYWPRLGDVQRVLESSLLSLQFGEICLELISFQKLGYYIVGTSQSRIVIITVQGVNGHHILQRELKKPIGIIGNLTSWLGSWKNRSIHPTFKSGHNSSSGLNPSSSAHISSEKKIQADDMRCRFVITSKSSDHFCNLWILTSHLQCWLLTEDTAEKILLDYDIYETISQLVVKEQERSFGGSITSQIILLDLLVNSSLGIVSILTGLVPFIDNGEDEKSVGKPYYIQYMIFNFSISANPSSEFTHLGYDQDPPPRPTNMQANFIFLSKNISFQYLSTQVLPLEISYTNDDNWHSLNSTGIIAPLISTGLGGPVTSAFVHWSSLVICTKVPFDDGAAEVLSSSIKRDNESIIGYGSTSHFALYIIPRYGIIRVQQLGHKGLSKTQSTPFSRSITTTHPSNLPPYSAQLQPEKRITQSKEVNHSKSLSNSESFTMKSSDSIEIEPSFRAMKSTKIMIEPPSLEEMMNPLQSHLAESLWIYCNKNQSSSSQTIQSNSTSSWKASVEPFLQYNRSDSLVSRLAQALIDQKPFCDPRWAEDPNSKYADSQTAQILLQQQLADKQCSYILFSQFLVESTLWDYLGFSCRASIHEYGEKIAASAALRALDSQMLLDLEMSSNLHQHDPYPTKYPENISHLDLRLRHSIASNLGTDSISFSIINESMMRCLEERGITQSHWASQGLGPQDLFYSDISKIEDIARYIVQIENQFIRSMGSNLISPKDILSRFRLIFNANQALETIFVTTHIYRQQNITNLIDKEAERKEIDNLDRHRHPSNHWHQHSSNSPLPSSNASNTSPSPNRPTLWTWHPTIRSLLKEQIQITRQFISQMGPLVSESDNQPETNLPKDLGSSSTMSTKPSTAINNQSSSSSSSSMNPYQSKKRVGGATDWRQDLDMDFLFIQLYNLSDVLLSDMQHQIQITDQYVHQISSSHRSREEGERDEMMPSSEDFLWMNERKELEEKFRTLRQQLILPFSSNPAHYSQALRLAETYHEFNILVEICEKTQDEERLERYIERYSNQEFDIFLFDWYLSHNLKHKLLNVKWHHWDSLARFFKSSEMEKDDRRQEISWIHQILQSDYDHAQSVLYNLANMETKYASRKNTLYSLSKLCSLLASTSDQKSDNSKFPINQKIVGHSPDLSNRSTSAFDGAKLEQQLTLLRFQTQLKELDLQAGNQNDYELPLSSADICIHFIDLSHQSQALARVDFFLLSMELYVSTLLLRSNSDNDSLLIEIWIRAILSDEWQALANAWQQNELDDQTLVHQIKRSIFYAIGYRDALIHLPPSLFQSLLNDSVLLGDEFSTPSIRRVLTLTYRQIEQDLATS